MEYNKKVGIILMVGSVLFAILSFFISECDYCIVGAENLFFLVMTNTLRFRFFFDETAYPPYLIDVSIKYIFLLCTTAFAAGLLFYLGALNAPRLKKSEQSTSQTDK